MRRLALAVEGDGTHFPPLAQVAQWLEALALRAWVPGGRATPPSAANARRDLLGVSVPAVRHPCHHLARRERPLALSEEAVEVRALAQSELVATLNYAAELKSPWVIVELLPPSGGRPPDQESVSDRDALLDRCCRTLHGALQQGPAIGIALALPRERAGWLTPAFVEHVLADLGPRRALGWWHDSGRAHASAAQGGPPATAWLDRLAARCVGLDATDAVGVHSGLPAGAGEVDLAAVMGALASQTWIVVRSEPFQGPGPLLQAVRHLRGERDAAGDGGTRGARGGGR